MPRLSQLALKINIIMSTSCASESTFSIAGYIVGKTRARLSSQNLRYSILTKEEEKVEKILVELSNNSWKWLIKILSVYFLNKVWN